MQKNAVLIDVRSAEEFSSGHLQGAVNIPHTEIAEKISGVAAAKNTPLYLYCRSGRRVGLAMEVLQKLGYTVMFNLGGYEEAKKFMEKQGKMKLRVLMIGNSFSICVGNNLPQIVRLSKKHHLELTSAYIGGCPLALHAEHLRTAKKDPKFAPYRISYWNSDDLRHHAPRMGNVLELLKNNTYDVVTIQQASWGSWNFDTYYPHADEVISCIRKYNPDAKIIIQQTWSYRNDSSNFANWGFGSDEMYARLKKAYAAFAEKTGFDIIPTGDAVQIWRQDSKCVYTALTSEELSKYRSPDLPAMANDIVGKDFWKKDENGELVLAKDSVHLNFRGEYLQSCVWYGKLFGENPETIVYEPQNISRSECQFLRTCAKKALGF